METDNLEKEAQKEEIRKVAERIDKFIDEEGLICGRELKSVKLHLFKSMYTDKLSPDNEEQREELKARCEKIMRYERESRSNPDLPTIGVEIEVPADIIPDDDFFDGVLNMLGIPHFGGMTASGFKYFEVNPEFTYSAYAQSRIVEDLAEMGMYGRVPEPGQQYSKNMLSLHINLGVPSSLSDLTLEQIQEGSLFHEVDLLTNSMTYAFVSSERIRNRKSIESWDWTDDSVENSDRGGKKRMEIKISEMKDFTTFRQMEEVQRLARSMFFYMAKELGRSFKENMAENWLRFRSEILEVFQKFHVEMNIYEVQNKRDEAADIAQNKRFRSEIRSILTKHSSMQIQDTN